ncbi:MAG: GNAT family N-acetyltransferase [Bacteroidia bacterium]|nr:GNAT family N-acetyltransferase [Bacteroidia bacterium]
MIKRNYLDFKVIGFAFLQTFSNKGYAYEATKAVLENLAVETVFAVTLQENQSSIKLIEKLGLKFERIIEQNNEKLHLYQIRLQFIID